MSQQLKGFHIQIEYSRTIRLEQTARKSRFIVKDCNGTAFIRAAAQAGRYKSK